MRKTLCVVGLVCLCAVAAGSAQAPPARPLTARVYDSVGASRSDLATAQGVARSIFSDAGVDVIFRACVPRSAVVRGDEDVCDDVPRATEVLVRLVNGPPVTTRLTALGDSLIDVATRSAKLATIYVDRISTVAAGVRVDAGVLLGRTLAHEIGHLVLGSATHADNGLMRSYWRRQMLRSHRKKDWLFTAPQVAAIASTLSRWGAVERASAQPSESAVVAVIAQGGDVK